MQFSYWERYLEVFSDEEGVYKNISGYLQREQDYNDTHLVSINVDCEDDPRSKEEQKKEAKKEG